MDKYQVKLYTMNARSNKINMSIRIQENKLFDTVKLANPAIVIDGVVDEAEFLSSKFKIVFILKEVNGGESWDLREFLYNGGRSQTWDNIARWTEEILNIDKSYQWAYLEQHNEERRKTYLKKICAVNIKKTSGSHTSNNKVITAAAKENKEFLKQQLELYHADIIICCGIDGHFFDFLFGNESSGWKMTSRGIWFRDDGSKMLISFSHPTSRTRDCFLHYALIDAVREILKNRLTGICFD